MHQPGLGVWVSVRNAVAMSDAAWEQEMEQISSTFCVLLLA